MEHHFNVEVAEQVGVEKAILLYNIAYWIRHNVANKQHFYDERTWTYNSAQAFAKLFPYMKARSIAQRLQELETAGYLISSKKYNDSGYNHTKWYALTKKYYSISKIRQSDSEDRQSLKGADNNPDNKQKPHTPPEGSCGGNNQPKTKGLRAIGTNSRATRTNPRATGSNPRNKVTATSSNNGELFEKFWEEYPRKVGRKKCQQIWDRLKPSAELAGQIVKAVRAYKRTEQWLKDNGEFVPHPSTFLNQARWEDELPTKPEPQRGDPDWLPTEEEAQEIMRDAGLIK